jgi:hypothetical protein
MILLMFLWLCSLLFLLWLVVDWWFGIDECCDVCVIWWLLVWLTWWWWWLLMVLINGGDGGWRRDL